MKKLGAGIKDIMTALSGGDDAARKAARAAEVNVLWRNAVEAVYKDAAPMVLSHVNAVYIMDADVPVAGSRDGVSGRRAPHAEPLGKPGAENSRARRRTQLVVYADDSLIRSDLDARQEFLKIQLNGKGERIDAFRILPSTFDMKARHPFSPREERTAAARGSASCGEAPSDAEPLSSEQRAALEEKARGVENTAVQKALLKAIEADMKRNSIREAKNNK